MARPGALVPTTRPRVTSTTCSAGSGGARTYASDPAVATTSTCRSPSTWKLSRPSGEYAASPWPPGPLVNSSPAAATKLEARSSSVRTLQSRVSMTCRPAGRRSASRLRPGAIRRRCRSPRARSVPRRSTRLGARAPPGHWPQQRALAAPAADPAATPGPRAGDRSRAGVAGRSQPRAGARTRRMRAAGPSQPPARARARVRPMAPRRRHRAADTPSSGSRSTPPAASTVTSLAGPIVSGGASSSTGPSADPATRTSRPPAGGARRPARRSGRQRRQWPSPRRSTRAARRRSTGGLAAATQRRPARRARACAGGRASASAPRRSDAATTPGRSRRPGATRRAIAPGLERRPQVHSATGQRPQRHRSDPRKRACAAVVANAQQQSGRRSGPLLGRRVQAGAGRQGHDEGERNGGERVTRPTPKL